MNDSFQSEQLAQQLGHQVALKSDGNPFFVFEIIRGLREGQFITQQDDGTWISTRVIDDIQISSSVLDLVNARVSDLTEEERDLLDVACCWGFDFDPDLIGDVLGLARIPFPEGARGQNALRYLHPAQTHLAESYLQDQMVALSERALEISDLLVGAERAKVLFILTEGPNMMGRREREAHALHEAKQLAEESGDDPLRYRALSRLGSYYLSTADMTMHCAFFSRRSSSHPRPTAQFTRHVLSWLWAPSFNTKAVPRKRAGRSRKP